MLGLYREPGQPLFGSEELAFLRHAAPRLAEGAQRWTSFDGDWQAGGRLPAVLGVAGRALRTAEHPDAPSEVAVARVLSRSAAGWCCTGPRWSPTGRGGWPSSSSPHPAPISPLLMAAYGLTRP